MNDDTARVVSTIDSNALTSIDRGFAGLINAWIDEKHNISRSRRMPTIYCSTIESFRSTLLNADLDLDIQYAQLLQSHKPGLAHVQRAARDPGLRVRVPLSNGSQS